MRYKIDIDINSVVEFVGDQGMITTYDAKIDTDPQGPSPRLVLRTIFACCVAMGHEQDISDDTLTEIYEEVLHSSRASMPGGLLN